MSTFHRIRTAATALLSMGAIFTLLAPVALAQRPPAEPTYPAQPASGAVISHGSPVWMFIVVAVVVVAVTMTALVAKRRLHYRPRARSAHV